METHGKDRKEREFKTVGEDRRRKKIITHRN